MDNLYVNQKDILNSTKKMCDSFACYTIQKIFENRNISNYEKLERADIALEIHRRIKDETDINKIREAISILEQEVVEKRGNGDI